MPFEPNPVFPISHVHIFKGDEKNNTIFFTNRVNLKIY